ncbi:hypothetical protein [Fluviispira sanaruensis]|uniref:Uncharacterized protein n=1 Tax=Fluviispira sanaruensis TaxID=2493639 RepID=A0A4P2VPF4_FLUSA|nr:hypothetical protein [Fluviispira sanaruensis]BBH53639.1 hypothetical protein JCM31447_20860 [Fluviispira sanaruensis]
MRRKIIYSIVFFIAFLNIIFIFSNLNADSGHENPSHEVKKVNGEEVYEPKSDEHALKKMTLPEAKKGEKKTEKKEIETKDPHGTMVNTQTNMEKSKEHSSESMKKEMSHPKDSMKEHETNKKEMSHPKDSMKEHETNKKEMNEKEMAKSTKLTNFEEEPFNIYRPKGYIWFAAVFVILLFVIFVFT